MNKEIIFCSIRKCPHTECLRHDLNAPWEVVFTRRKFNPDKNWKCKDILLEEKEGNKEKDEKDISSRCY